MNSRIAGTGFYADPNGALIVSDGSNPAGFGNWEGNVDRSQAALANDSITAGAVVGVRIKASASGTATKVQFHTGSQAITAVTDFKLGIWTADGSTVLATTANESANGGLVINSLVTLNLVTPLAIVAGTEYMVGGGGVGTSVPNFRGYSGLAALNPLPPVLSRSASGWAGGALPVLGSLAAQHRWFRMVP